MTLSFAGLGFLSIPRSLLWSTYFIHGDGEIRSLFFALLVLVVVIVLAYLTNPSENSFRTFLTEQSFRQHLSRLAYNNDDDHVDLDDTAYSLIRKSRSDRISSNIDVATTAAAGTSTLTTNGSQPFHFANRASVSLRTPKHVFHSLGICTIAAVVPFPSTNRGSGHGHGTDQDGSTILDSWFIGAFGRWWRGGVLEAWYRDVVHRSKDEEGWSSGILGFKALDQFSDYNGLPFAKPNSKTRLPVRGSPPKLRNRERTGGLPHRSSTPPPLPKSASLPLHATRLPSSSSSSSTPAPTAHDVRHAQVDRSLGQACQSQPQLPIAMISPSSAIHSRSSSAILEQQSPIIAEVLRQISSSKNTVRDLRTQLTEFQSAASQSHMSLQNEVDLYRERRRQEEVARVELKSKTKTLEDSKRHAEGHKREVEKRLKAAQNARDECTRRITHLDSENTRLEQRSIDDQAAMELCNIDTAKAEQEISDAVELKKQDIKDAEEVIVALSVRAKELEEKLVGERERLRLVRERAEIRKQDQSFFPFSVVNPTASERSSSAWTPILFGPAPTEAARAEYLDGHVNRDTSFVTTDNITTESRDISRSPRPASLSLGGLSNFSSGGDASQVTDAISTALRTNGYIIFDDNITSLQSQSKPTTNFSPFEDADSTTAARSMSTYNSNNNTHHPLTLTSSSHIPTGLIGNSESFSRSFQSENDIYLEKDWRGLQQQHGGGRLTMHSQPVDMSPSQALSSGPRMTASPLTVIDSSSFNDHDIFEVRHRHPEYTRVDSMNMQRATMPVTPPNRAFSDPVNSIQDPVVDKAGRRRWFSTASLKEKPKKGLNPDAKVFRLTKTPVGSIGGGPAVAPTPTNNPTFDALNPNGLGSRVITTPSSNAHSLLRAFAPSPAERQVLQRALGGSTNASLERLPSLSRVSSISSSPSHVHAVPAPGVGPGTGHTRPISLHMDRGEVGRTLPSWLLALPRIGKSNFSPWDDDEPVGRSSSSGGVSPQ